MISPVEGWIRGFLLRELAMSWIPHSQLTQKHLYGPAIATSRRAAASSSVGNKVYLIRHGESEWNLGWKRKNFWKMFCQRDHPLTEEGTAQAQRLSEKIRRLVHEGDIDALQVTASDTRVYSSPLTRAVATAALVLGCERRIQLVPDAREIAWPVCGPDALGRAVGPQIADRAADTLSSYVEDFCGSSASRQDLIQSLDYSLAEQQWWAYYHEPRHAMKTRLQRLLLTLATPPSAKSVLVCHCMMLQRLFKDFAAPSFSSSRPELLEQLRARKLKNCGVLAVILDQNGLIHDAELVLGSQLLR